MFSYNKHEANKILIKGNIYYRTLVRYPQRTQLPCAIKGCIHKKRNGRCGLKECHLELDGDENLTGTCLSFKHKKQKEKKMPGRNKKGPSPNSTGPRTGIGGGKGTHSSNKQGTGKKTGGKRGSC